MQVKDQLTAAAAELARLIKGVDEAQFPLLTPGADQTVQGLLNHIVAWSPVVEAIGAGMPLAPGRPDESISYLPGDWRGRLLASLDRISESWYSDATWEGRTELGFANVPTVVIGEKTIIEYVVHGWDLAKATGQELIVAPEVAATTLRAVRATAEESRRAGMFGPDVAVPESAGALAQALGASGRNPGWTAA
ncbi:TIGR03086 family metal-binding protein [Streptomyces sp. NPDC056161]|uniref:TIGR03086 family metal-binding protein n=1 Tax=Streptomyces sp. NPDC056161 TaxID=3345732 RepID=UPI0035DD81A3